MLSVTLSMPHVFSGISSILPTPKIKRCGRADLPSPCSQQAASPCSPQAGRRPWVQKLSLGSGNHCTRRKDFRVQSGFGNAKDLVQPIGKVMTDLSARCSGHRKTSELGHESRPAVGAEGRPLDAGECHTRMEGAFNRQAQLGRRRVLSVAMSIAAFALNGLGADAATAAGESFGFDGLGHVEKDYIPGRVVALAQAGDGAVLFVGVDGYELPMRMVIGAAEAMSVLTAAQERRTSRPVTHEAWGSTLAAIGWKVERVAITSIESNIFFSRVVLSPDDGPKPARTIVASQTSLQRSVDMRPSDAIALALRCHAPLFVARDVAEEIVGRVLEGGAEVPGEHKASAEARLDSRGLTASIGPLVPIGAMGLNL